MRFSKKTFSAAFVAAGVLMAAGCAANNSVHSEQTQIIVTKAVAQKLVTKITKGIGTVTKVMAGPAGLDVLSVNLEGRKSLALITVNGKNLIIADAIFNEKGENLLQQYAEKAGLLAKPLPAKKLTSDIAHSATSFVVGKSGPEITAFVDPNCIFCHKFYTNVMPLVQDGKLRVRFVVVAFLKNSSLPKAEAILSAANPAQALATNEALFNVKTEEGGIVPIQKPSPTVMGDVERNTFLLRSTGEMATPTILYCNKQNEPVVAHGIPRDADSFLKSITHTMTDKGTCK